MIAINEILKNAKQEFIASDLPPDLEAEILLAHVLNVDRSYLIAYASQILSQEESDNFESLIQNRIKGIPLAYLTGHKEFWSLDLVVTPDTLIPRPETELLIEIIFQQKVASQTAITIADLGTGSGAIALAIADEKPTWEVFATDASEKALQVAKLNAQRLHIANVKFYPGKWFAPFKAEAKSACFDIIVSNPPYLAKDDPHLQGEIKYEPLEALVAGTDGLQDIRLIIQQSRHYLKTGGFLILEHGFDQAQAVQKIFIDNKFQQVETRNDLAGNPRVTFGFM